MGLLTSACGAATPRADHECVSAWLRAGYCRRSARCELVEPHGERCGTGCAHLIRAGESAVRRFVAQVAEGEVVVICRTVDGRRVCAEDISHSAIPAMECR